MNNTLLKILSNRRSVYGLDKKIKLNNFEIEQLLMEALKIAPSAFDCQSSRIVLLLSEQHHLFWQQTFDILKTIVPSAQQNATHEKIKSFEDAYGTILFFEDMKISDSLKKKYPLYQDRFANWSEHSNGMLQYIIWTLFANQNIGASLQHYNPVIDDMVHKTWNIDLAWRLIAQMPFGNIVQAPMPRKIIAPEKRMRIFE